MRRLGLFLWLSQTMLVALVPFARAADPASADDFLLVLAAAPYPLEILAYCHSIVAPDAALQDAGRAWNEHNGEMLANVEKKAEAVAIPAEIRRQADEAALKNIEATVAAQFDKPAFCGTIARLIDSGYYDIDRRADLKDALKRIFGVD